MRDWNTEFPPGTRVEFSIIKRTEKGRGEVVGQHALFPGLGLVNLDPNTPEAVRFATTYHEPGGLPRILYDRMRRLVVLSRREIVESSAPASVKLLDITSR